MQAVCRQKRLDSHLVRLRFIPRDDLLQKTACLTCGAQSSAVIVTSQRLCKQCVSRNMAILMDGASFGAAATEFIQTLRDGNKCNSRGSP